jgi:hypothetical protein
MIETRRPFGSSTKLWLSVTAVSVLAGIAILVYNALPPSRQDIAIPPPPPPAATVAVEPTRQPVSPFPPADLSADEGLPALDPAQPSTPAAKEALQKALVNQQADYLQELRAKYPKTASLPTAEQIEEMRKTGEMVW